MHADVRCTVGGINIHVVRVNWMPAVSEVWWKVLACVV